MEVRAFLLSFKNSRVSQRRSFLIVQMIFMSKNVVMYSKTSQASDVVSCSCRQLPSDVSAFG